METKVTPSTMITFNSGHALYTVAPPLFVT